MRKYIVILILGLSISLIGLYGSRVCGKENNSSNWSIVTSKTAAKTITLPISLINPATVNTKVRLTVTTTCHDSYVGTGKDYSLSARFCIIPAGSLSPSTPVTLSVVNNPIYNQDRPITIRLSNDQNRQFHFSKLIVIIHDDARPNLIDITKPGHGLRPCACDGSDDTAHLQAIQDWIAAHRGGVVLYPNNKTCWIVSDKWTGVRMHSTPQITQAGNITDGGTHTAKVKVRLLPATHYFFPIDYSYYDNNYIWSSSKDSPYSVWSNIVIDGNAANPGLGKVEQQYLIEVGASPGKNYKNQGRLRVLLDNCTVQYGNWGGVTAMPNADIETYNCDFINNRFGLLGLGGYSKFRIRKTNITVDYSKYPVDWNAIHQEYGGYTVNGYNNNGYVDWDVDGVGCTVNGYISLTQDWPPIWKPNTHYTAKAHGVIATNYDGYVYVAQTSGYSGNQEPKWPAADRQEVVDNQVTWKAYSMYNPTTTIKNLTQSGPLNTRYFGFRGGATHIRLTGGSLSGYAGNPSGGYFAEPWDTIITNVTFLGIRPRNGSLPKGGLNITNNSSKNCAITFDRCIFTPSNDPTWGIAGNGLPIILISAKAGLNPSITLKNCIYGDGYSNALWQPSDCSIIIDGGTFNQTDSNAAIAYLADGSNSHPFNLTLKNISDRNLGRLAKFLVFYYVHGNSPPNQSRLTFENVVISQSKNIVSLTYGNLNNIKVTGYRTINAPDNIPPSAATCGFVGDHYVLRNNSVYVCTHAGAGKRAVWQQQ
jgi:hypothetical protein